MGKIQNYIQHAWNAFQDKNNNPLETSYELGQ